MSEIAELYARDPLELTIDDRKKLIEDLRKRRQQFKTGDKTAGKVSSSSKNKLTTVDLSALLDKPKAGGKK